MRLSEQLLPAYLHNLQESGLIPHTFADSRTIEVESVGDGNINWVRRAVDPGSGRGLVVKQARAALEAFPEYSVSTERISFEVRYFETAEPFDPEGICPRIHHFDRENSVLVLEDLSSCDRLDGLLAGGSNVTEAVGQLAAFLGRVHSGTSHADAFDNDEMRRLHGDHIFFLPYRDNDFPLSPAIAVIAESIRRDAGLVSLIDAAYRRYLDPTGALLHADVQPTNILVGRSGPKLIDAEIAHIGDPAFDIGVLLAHLRLASLASGREIGISGVWTRYANAFTHREPPQFQDVARYAGIEMLRRTLGAARAPGVDRDECASRVLALGRQLIEDPPERAF